MPKRIEFIAPVEAVRGNMSGKQNLVYPSSDNSAFEAVPDKVNYARNYRPSYIGAKRSSDGLKYFSVRTKNAVTLTQTALRNMATNGASFGITSKILADESLATALGTQWDEAVRQGQFSGNLRQFINFYVNQMVGGYMTTISINFIGLANTLKNPWMNSDDIDYAPSKDVLVKFWTYLHIAGTNFYVNNLTGIAEEGFKFDDMIPSGGGDNWMNVLGLTTETIGSNSYVKMGALYLLNPSGEYVQAGDDIIADGKYKTTAVVPTA